ncbi:MAG: GMP synthase [Gammaproteobacteria bacterium]|nr:GMP synthase [Gammaproteobacteria bacterium]
MALESSTRSLRIGILKTDRVREEFIDRHGDYPDMFHQLLRDAARAAGMPEPVFHDYDVQHGHYPAEVGECDGYVITGSRDSVYDDHPWIAELSDFVLKLHQRRHKLIGICFGHQLIAQALGGETRAAAGGWAVGVHASRVTAAPAWMCPQQEQFALLSSHQDQVMRLPEGAALLAENDFCPNAAFTIGDHILAIQGHPEFAKPYSADLMAFRRELLGEAVYQRGVASLEMPIQRELVGQWMLAFLSWQEAAREAAETGGHP